MTSACFINGSYAEGTSGAWGEVINPADGSVVARMQWAGVDDVNKAVAAAKVAFETWSRTTPVERSTLLHALARRMEERAEEYVRVETSQTGKPLRLCREFDVPGSIDNTAFFAGAARNLEGKAAAEWDGTHTSMIRREPIGVIGSVAPWNYPLQMAMWKILPAVAAGNTIVLKPAEITPLTSLMVAEDAASVGFPPGVINVVVGAGPVAGEALISHPDVRMVSFTGSTPVGKRVMELATATIKRVHLELGGKAPFVVFADADLDAAVQGAAAGALINTGQDCTAATRAYVQRPLYDAFVNKVTELFGRIVVGRSHRP
jgi:betaine-aldehyde dehydrogenase